MSDGEDVNITKRINKDFVSYLCVFLTLFGEKRNTVSSKENERVFASRREDDTDTIFTRVYNNKWYQK